MNVLMIDNGLNTEFARVLGASGRFDNVSYFSPWQADFVATRERAVGTGFDEYDRIFDISADTLHGYNAFIFPDLYWKDLATQLRAEGYPVMASFDAEELELDRALLLNMMHRNDMPMPKFKIVEGVDEALETAKDGDFIKINGYSRADIETCRHDDKFPIWAVRLKAQLGPLSETIPIVINKPIKEEAEGGWDQLLLGGVLQYPFLIGYEDKDAAYVAKVVNKVPDKYATQNAKIIEELSGYEYSNFLSTEYRGDILIDITTRMPSPPGDIHLALWNKLMYNIYNYLDGEETTSLSPKAKYAVQLIVKSHKQDEFVWFDIPDELRDRVGVRRAFKHDGLTWSAPAKTEDLEEVGGIVGLGSSPEAAIEDAERILDEIKFNHNCDCYPGAARELLKVAEKGEKEGIEF